MGNYDYLCVWKSKSPNRCYDPATWAHTGVLGQFSLGVAVGGSDAFEVGFREVLYHYGDSWSMGIL